MYVKENADLGTYRLGAKFATVVTGYCGVTNIIYYESATHLDNDTPYSGEEFASPLLAFHSLITDGYVEASFNM